MPDHNNFVSICFLVFIEIINMRPKNKDRTMWSFNCQIILLLIIVCLAINNTCDESFESDYCSIIYIIFHIYSFISVMFE